MPQQIHHFSERRRRERTCFTPGSNRCLDFRTGLALLAKLRCELPYRGAASITAVRLLAHRVWGLTLDLVRALTENHSGTSVRVSGYDGRLSLEVLRQWQNCLSDFLFERFI